MTLVADPAECSFQFGYLQVHQFVRHRQASVGCHSVNYENVTGAGVAQIKVGDKVIPSYSSKGLAADEARSKDAAFKKDVVSAIKAVGFQPKG